MLRMYKKNVFQSYLNVYKNQNCVFDCEQIIHCFSLDSLFHLPLIVHSLISFIS